MPLLAVALAAIAVVPSVGAAPKPDQTLTISAAPGTVTFGNELKITGQLSGGDARDISGQNVTLQADEFPYEGKFERVASGDTNDTGAYSLTVKPMRTSKYRATAKGGVTSPEVIVPVRVLVTLKVSDKTPKAGSRVTFSGDVAPPHDGKAVRIQRKTSSGWKTVKKTTLTDGGDLVSKFSTRVKIGKSGKYRARFRPGDGDHAPGNSKAIRLTTH